MNKIENSLFKRLVGRWRTEGTILETDNNPESTISGTDSYEFILNGHFILHKADVLMDGNRSETYELIQLDNSVDKVKMQYYNSDGETGIMHGFLSDDEFRIEGSNLRFNGNLSDNDTKITGRWQIRSESSSWIDFLEIKLTRINQMV